MQRLGPDALAIFWSAPERVYSTDVNYEYRQESNLLYLTAVDQEETILVLIPGSEGAKEFLFIREADARREHARLEQRERELRARFQAILGERVGPLH